MEYDALMAYLAKERAEESREAALWELRLELHAPEPPVKPEDGEVRYELDPEIPF
jgi:hypothetical protein